MPEKSTGIENIINKIDFDKIFSQSNRSIVILVIGLGLGIFSSLFMLITGTSVLSGSAGSIISGLFIFFMMLSALAFYLIMSSLQTLKKIKKSGIEKKILSEIAKHKGRVTSMEVALSTELNFEDVKSVLEQLCIAGAGEAQVTEKGEIIYLFNGLVSDEEKKQAKSPMAFT